MPSCLKLSEIFSKDRDFAWRLLEAECSIYMNKQITMDAIAQISQLYMKATEKLNTIQDQRQKYFSMKMQKLMAKPYVIRCFSNENQGKKNQLESKRREIQQIVTQQNEKTNSQRLNHMISQYGQKQKKIKSKIDKILSDHQKNLQQRLKKRNSKIDRLSLIQTIETSSNQKNGTRFQKFWNNFKQFNPESSRTTTTSQYIQLNSP